MSESVMEERAPGTTPLHLWIVGGLSLLWNGFGGFDYLMSQTRNRAYLEGMFPDPAQVDSMLAYMDSFPLWAVALWALGVWGGVAGSVLLLLRHRWAVGAFAASIVGMVGGLGYQLFGPPAPAFTQEGGMAMMPWVIFIIGIALYFYARAMRARGVLR